MNLKTNNFGGRVVVEVQGRDDVDLDLGRVMGLSYAEMDKL